MFGIRVLVNGRLTLLRVFMFSIGFFCGRLGTNADD
jgi:hypothetical protein